MHTLALLLALTNPAFAAPTDAVAASDPTRGGERGDTTGGERGGNTGGDRGGETGGGAERGGGADRGGDKDGDKGGDKGGETEKPETTPLPAKGGGGSRRQADDDQKKRKKKRNKNAFTIDSVNPLYGTLVYGPKLGTHSKYRGAASKKKPTVVKKADLPERKVDRSETKSIGFRGGALIHGQTDGNTYTDLGAGMLFRVRPWEAVALQFDLTHHADGFPGADRPQTLIGAAGEIFFFPWAGASPYVLVGGVSNLRPEPGFGLSNMFGVQGGLGLELALGKGAAFDIEGRLIGWANQDADEVENPTAGQLTGALVINF